MNIIVDPPVMGQASVIKELIELSSGHKAEAIYYNRPDKQVICLSTQLSCAVGCVFCASPDGNKTVNLSMHDMLEQIAHMNKYAEDDKVMLFSFMGEGEPMQNYTNLIDTIDMLGINSATIPYPFRVAVSTSGVKPHTIKKFAHYANQSDIDIKLQLSLHAPTDEGRKKIMPVSKPLKEVMDAMQVYQNVADGPIDINYVLIKGVNDSVDDAHELTDLCQNFHVKISKYNNVPWLDFEESDNKDAFLAVLNDTGVSYEYHMTDGEKNNAACGQTRGQAS